MEMPRQNCLGGLFLILSPNTRTLNRLTRGQETGSGMQKEKQTLKGTLALKIALLLNYLSKEDFRKFCAEIKAENDAGREISKSDLLRKYMGQMDFDRLKHNCTIFDTEQSDNRFGELCIAFGFLTPFNLELALEDQRQLADMGKKVPLGTILVDAGLLAKGERDLVIHKQKGFGNETSEKGRTGQSFLQTNEAGHNNRPNREIHK